MVKHEYGGYIEFECYHGDLYHKNAIALNCGRNALVYLYGAKKIRRIYLPYFLCTSVSEVCNKVGVEVEYYQIDRDFHPQLNKKLEEEEYLYLVNYYGQLSEEKISFFKERYGNIIVDNAQNYYQMPVEGTDTIYTCRKYFGVPDGAFLYTNLEWNCELPWDESFGRMQFLLGRYERGANEFYQEYVANNKIFANEPVKKMSKLTRNLLRGIDYGRIGKQRRDNFAFLDGCLNQYNRIRRLAIPFGAFMYPLLVEDGFRVRQMLLQEHIYIPVLWPNVLETCGRDMLEYDLAANIVPLPVDQRYDLHDVEYIAEVVKRCIG